MIVGGHHQDALPSTGMDEARGFYRLFPRVSGSVRQLYDRGGGHAKRFEIVLHHVRYADILAQHSAAGHNHGRYLFAVQFRGMKGAIRRVVVVTKDYQRIGWRGWFVYHPKLPGEPH